MGKTLKIIETFLSIQGEGIHSGLPTYFIRLAGCNLRCSYCDTKYSYGAGITRKVEDIISGVQKYDFKLVCITGGEPLLQAATKYLVDNLLIRGYKIDIETNGSLDIRSFCDSKNILYSLDIKCPSSGMTNKMKFSNLSFLKRKDQVKFIISNNEDYEFSREIVRKYDLSKKTNVIFSPVGGIKAAKLINWILKDALDVRVGLQIHKVIWGEGKDETELVC